MTTLNDCLQEVSKNAFDVVENNQTLDDQLEELKKMYEPVVEVYI